VISQKKITQLIGLHLVQVTIGKILDIHIAMKSTNTERK